MAIYSSLIRIQAGALQNKNDILILLLQFLKCLL